MSMETDGIEKRLDAALIAIGHLRVEAETSNARLDKIIELLSDGNHR